MKWASPTSRPSAEFGVSQSMCWWTLGDTAKTRHATPSASIISGPRPSPDGRWVAYTDVPRDVRHVSIVPFPGPAMRVDQNGGGLPVWRREGRGLLLADRQGMTEVMLVFTPNPVVADTRRVIDGSVDLGIV